MNREFGKAVYYLLYNPPDLPCTVNYPLRQRIRVDASPVGSRVVDAEQLYQALGCLKEGESPTYSMLKKACVNSDWPLEIWAADLLLTCQVGQQFDDSNDDRVHYFLERRSGPIGAALAASITLPDQS